MALEAARALPAAGRSPFVQRVRDEVAAGLGMSARYGGEAQPMVAVQRANSLRLLAAAERLADRPAAAAAAQAGVVEGYHGAWRARKNERNRTRLCAAWLEEIDLWLLAGDAAAARKSAEAMVIAFTGEGLELARAANCLARVASALRLADAVTADALARHAVQALTQAAGSGFKDLARLREGAEFAPLRSCEGAMAVIDAIER
jgi:hypothetical protein